MPAVIALDWSVAPFVLLLSVLGGAGTAGLARRDPPNRTMWLRAATACAAVAVVLAIALIIRLLVTG